MIEILESVAMKHWVELKDIKLYAYHGCMEEERIIGSEYLVQLKVETDFSKAAKTDNLEDAVDYVALYKIVEEEMRIPADLLENVAYRIYNRIVESCTTVSKVYLTVSKLNPPIDGNAKSVSVSLES